MKKLLVAALMVLLASPAFAAIQNVKVSGDITASYVDRQNFVLGDNTLNSTGLKSQSVFISQTRLRVDADLSDNVSTTVGLINERAWNGETTYSTGAYDTNVQLYLASITLREFLYSPLTLSIGRQVFNYGNGFVMGDGGAINQGTGPLATVAQDLTMRTAYDGIKAILDYKPLTIDLIYFKNAQTAKSVSGFGNLPSGESSDVLGYNANYQLNDAWSTVVEQYLFSRVNGAGYNGNVGTGKGSTLYVPGLRASTNPIKGLNVQGEVAMELGTASIANINNSAQFEAEHRDAMAAQLLASYSLPVLAKYKPTVNASYTYVSGDKNSANNYDGSQVKSAKTYSAWDEFNTIEGAGTIYRTLFPFSNENIISLGASASPLEDVTTTLTWSDLWAADKFGAQNPLMVYQPNNTTLQTIGYSSKKGAKGLGNEYDAGVTYNYTEDVTFGVSIGWYVPGSALADTNRGTASQAIANVGVKF